MVTLLLDAGIVALVTWQRDADKSLFFELKKPVLAGIQFGLGLLLIFMLYSIVAGLTPIEVLENSMKIHLELKRRCLPWLWLHSWDIIIFVGLPAFGQFDLGLTRWGEPWVRQLAETLALTLLILVLSGTARGETGRLLMDESRRKANKQR